MGATPYVHKRANDFLSISLSAEVGVGCRVACGTPTRNDKDEGAMHDMII